MPTLFRPFDEGGFGGYGLPRRFAPRNDRDSKKPTQMGRL